MKTNDIVNVDDLIAELEKYKGQGKELTVLRGLNHYTIKSIEEEDEIEGDNTLYLRLK